MGQPGTGGAPGSVVGVWWATHGTDEWGPWTSPAVAAWHLHQRLADNPVAIEVHVPATELRSPGGDRYPVHEALQSVAKGSASACELNWITVPPAGLQKWEFSGGEVRADNRSRLGKRNDSGDRSHRSDHCVPVPAKLSRSPLGVAVHVAMSMGEGTGVFNLASASQRPLDPLRAEEGSRHRQTPQLHARGLETRRS